MIQIISKTADRALGLAANVTDRDRLLIRTHVGNHLEDPAAAVWAESLAALFPHDPEALTRAAEVLSDVSRAAALLNQSIALDSAAGINATAICRLCDELYALARRYDWADSVTATEQTLRRWIRLRPGDFGPWSELADHFEHRGRRAEAEVALRRAYSLGAPKRSADRRLVQSLLADDLATVNSICGPPLADDDFQLRWLCTIGLRMQGRYLAAQRLALRGSFSDSSEAQAIDHVHVAVLDFELGRPLAAAAHFVRFAQAWARDARLPGRQARNIAWNLTLAGTAFAKGDDTARVRSLIDTVQRTGRRSLFPRDPLLHHFLRGLLLSKAKQHDAAVREFHAAMIAPSKGYTRINLELAHSLLALKRPAEAIPPLRSALRGGLDGSGLYLTRTETHEALAQAFDAAGQADSAAAHYAIVERFWRNADPQVRPRYEAARARLATLGAGLSRPRLARRLSSRRCRAALGAVILGARALSSAG